MNKKLVTAAALLIAIGGATMVHAKGGKQFAKLDIDGNGIVSEAEFLEHSKKRFTKLDANGDGGVTQEEMKAAREARNAAREARKKKRKKNAQ